MAFDVERISAAMRALLVQCPGFIDGAALTDFCDAMSEAIVGELDTGGAGGVDLSGGSFVTWQADGSLSNEKKLTATTGVTVSIGPSDIFVGLTSGVISAGTKTVIGSGTVTVDTYGRVTGVASYTKPTVNYYGNEGSDLSHCGATLLDLIDKLVTAGVINKSQLPV